MSDDKSTTIPLGKAVPWLLGRRQAHELISPSMKITLRLMLGTARQWEVTNTWREQAGEKPEPPPFHRTVMEFLGRLNKIRVVAEREEAARQRALHTEQAKEAKKRMDNQPHVSRRVLNERRDRKRADIKQRRETIRADSSAEEGVATATIIE